MNKQTITLQKNTSMLNQYFKFKLSNCEFCKTLREILEQLKTIKSNEITIFDSDNNELVVYYARAKIIRNTNSPRITKINGHRVKIDDIKKLKNILIFTDKENLLEFII